MTTDTGPEIDSAIEDVEFLLIEGAWVDAEFTAIMIASGISDRVAAALLPRADRCIDGDAPGTESHSRPHGAARSRSRVRSPPSRG